MGKHVGQKTLSHARMGTTSAFIAVALLTSCQNSNLNRQSTAESLDRLDGVGAKQQCDASFALSSSVDASVIQAPQNPELVQTVKEALRAVPTKVQDVVFGIHKAKIMVTDTHVACRPLPGDHDLSSCQAITPTGPVIYLNNNAADIRYGASRAIAYYVSEIILANGYSAQKAAIGQAYLTDVARLEKSGQAGFKLESLKDYLPASLVGMLDPNMSEQQRQSYVASHLSSSARPSGLSADQWQLSNFYDAVVAETLHSAWCTAETKASLQAGGEFAETGIAYANLRSLLAKNAAAGPTVTSGLSLSGGLLGLLFKPFGWLFKLMFGSGLGSGGLSSPLGGQNALANGGSSGGSSCGLLNGGIPSAKNGGGGGLKSLGGQTQGGNSRPNNGGTFVNQLPVQPNSNQSAGGFNKNSANNMAQGPTAATVFSPSSSGQGSSSSDLSLPTTNPYGGASSASGNGNSSAGESGDWGNVSTAGGGTPSAATDATTPNWSGNAISEAGSWGDSSSSGAANSAAGGWSGGSSLGGDSTGGSQWDSGSSSGADSGGDWGTGSDSGGSW